jgi:hypothetical protein
MKNVRALLAVFQEKWNPFLENSQDLLVFDTRYIMETPVAETVRKIGSLREEQYTKFVEERLELSTKPGTDTQVATFQSVTDLNAVKAANATRRSEE